MNVYQSNIDCIKSCGGSIIPLHAIRAICPVRGCIYIIDQNNPIDIDKESMDILLERINIINIK